MPSRLNPLLLSLVATISVAISDVALAKPSVRRPIPAVTLCGIIQNPDFQRLPTYQQTAILSLIEMRENIQSAPDNPENKDILVPKQMYPLHQAWLEELRKTPVKAIDTIGNLIALKEAQGRVLAFIDRMDLSILKKLKEEEPERLEELSLRLDDVVSQRFSRAIETMRNGINTQTLNHQDLLEAMFWGTVRNSEFGWLDIAFSSRKMLESFGEREFTFDFVHELIDYRLSDFMRRTRHSELIVPLNTIATRHEFNAFHGLPISIYSTRGLAGTPDGVPRTGLKDLEHDEEHASASFSSKASFFNLHNSLFYYKDFIENYYPLYFGAVGITRMLITDIFFFLWHESTDVSSGNSGETTFKKAAAFISRNPHLLRGYFKSSLLQRYFNKDDFGYPSYINPDREITDEDYQEAVRQIMLKAGFSTKEVKNGRSR